MEYAEHFGPDLKLQLLAERRRLEQRQIEICVPGTYQRVPAQASEVLRARSARGCAAVACRVQRARDLERRQVQEVVGRVRAGERIADEVRARKELPRA